MLTTTRFAPSPTGYLHVGTTRTALFAYIFARQQGGRFILRIEDTDRQRQVDGAEQHIMDSLRWLGIAWDEGVDIGGPSAPYRQSERLDIYRKWAQQLVDKGLAYADPYSAEELNSLREKAKQDKRPFLYRDHRPLDPPVWDGSQPLRLLSSPGQYNWHDEVMGDLSAGPESIDDFILMKADGYPTYNFCHIIDDMLMGVTHIFRSQEFISSMPRFLDLYRALDITPPRFVTLPFVMAMEGTKKLSKRDGAKNLLDYGHDGYLPETMVNFLATLGWNDGTEQELFSIDELTSKFSLDQVQASPARFDTKRLEWMNGQWIRRLSVDELASRVGDFWPASAQTVDPAYRLQVLALVQDRLKTLADLPSMTEYFFAEPTPDLDLIRQNKQLSKLTDAELSQVLSVSKDTLASMNTFAPDDIQSTLNNLLESTGHKPAVLLGLIRVAVSWAPFSPALPETLSLLGHDVTLARLSSAIDLLDTN